MIGHKRSNYVCLVAGRVCVSHFHMKNGALDMQIKQAIDL